MRPTGSTRAHVAEPSLIWTRYPQANRKTCRFIPADSRPGNRTASCERPNRIGTISPRPERALSYLRTIRHESHPSTSTPDPHIDREMVDHLVAGVAAVRWLQLG
jgi:hypothetical protein